MHFVNNLRNMIINKTGKPLIYMRKYISLKTLIPKDAIEASNVIQLNEQQTQSTAVL